MTTVRMNLGLLILICGLVGCGDESNGTDMPLVFESLEEACEEACAAQATLRCHNDLGFRSCTGSCVRFPEHVPNCTDAWFDLNSCMALAPLFCDLQGHAAVSDVYCGAEIDAFLDC